MYVYSTLIVENVTKDDYVIVPVIDMWWNFFFLAYFYILLKAAHTTFESIIDGLFEISISRKTSSQEYSNAYIYWYVLHADFFLHYHYFFVLSYKAFFFS